MARCCSAPIPILMSLAARKHCDKDAVRVRKSQSRKGSGGIPRFIVRAAVPCQERPRCSALAQSRGVELLRTNLANNEPQPIFGNLSVHYCALHLPARLHMLLHPCLSSSTATTFTSAFPPRSSSNQVVLRRLSSCYAACVTMRRRSITKRG